MSNKIISKNNQIQNLEFSPQLKFNELKSSGEMSVAIKKTKEYIHEQCNRKDNTYEVLELYLEQYNLNKHFRGKMKQSIYDLFKYIFPILLTAITTISLPEIIRINPDSSWYVNIINNLGILVILITSIIFFVKMSTSFLKFIVNSLMTLSSEYDLYVLPYLCDMMYNRLKSEGFNPPKIPLDDL